jgi:hypothetical protein
MDAWLGVLLGVGLAAACGFRIFLPFLVLALFARAGAISLAPGFDWIGTDPAILAFGVATALEVTAYFVPWLDHALDALATPASLVAGTVAVAAVFGDVPPLLRWTVAAIAGGGTAGLVQGASVAARATSTLVTGGLGNVVVAGAELLGAAVTSVISLLIPAAGAALALVVCAFALALLLRRRNTPPASQNPADTCTR